MPLRGRLVWRSSLWGHSVARFFVISRYFAVRIAEQAQVVVLDVDEPRLSDLDGLGIGRWTVHDDRSDVNFFSCHG